MTHQLWMGIFGDTRPAEMSIVLDAVEEPDLRACKLGYASWLTDAFGTLTGYDCTLINRPDPFAIGALSREHFDNNLIEDVKNPDGSVRYEGGLNYVNRNLVAGIATVRAVHDAFIERYLNATGETHLTPLETRQLVKAYTNIGRALHALQDFYAHSDYIETLLGVAPGAYFNDTYLDIGAIPLWNTCSFAGATEIVSTGKVLDGLQTGFFYVNGLNARQCAAIGLCYDSSANASHDELNKDCSIGGCGFEIPICPDSPEGQVLVAGSFLTPPLGSLFEVLTGRKADSRDASLPDACEAAKQFGPGVAVRHTAQALFLVKGLLAEPVLGPCAGDFSSASQANAVRATDLDDIFAAAVESDPLFLAMADNLSELYGSVSVGGPAAYEIDLVDKDSGIPKEFLQGTDDDGDGVPYEADNCPFASNVDQLDSDADGVGDACDRCPLIFDPTNIACGPCGASGGDLDLDGICGQQDNCPMTFNPDQLDADGDSIGDACDDCTDADHDGYGSPGNSLCPRGPETDCDDSNANVYLGAQELCDGLDNNCNGVVDEDLPGQPLEIGINPDTLVFSVEPGQMFQRNLTVSNLGSSDCSDLSFVIDARCGDGVGTLTEAEGNTSRASFGENRYRGNVYAVTQRTTLTQIESYLNFTGPRDLQFVVFILDVQTGTYQLALSQTVSRTGAGEGFYSSDPISLRLESGKSYVIAVGWDGGNITYYFDPSIVGGSLRFGSQVDGFSASSFPLESSFTSYLGSNTYYQRLTTTDCWLTATPPTGRVQPGVPVTILVEADAKEKSSGDYTGALLISSNDPKNPLVTVPVEMSIACVDFDEDHYATCEGDCNDADPAIHPGAPELCDGVDNNCDGRIDEGFDVGSTCTSGTGACQSTGHLVCAPGGLSTVCSASQGQPHVEICNGIDDDCDGVIDNGFNVGLPCSVGVGACTRSGVTVCSPTGLSTACGAIPGFPAPETCNGIDDDCDGQTDEPADLGGVPCATSCVQAPSGMVGWWPGDNSPFDLQGGNHGTLVNGATYGSGVVGPAFRLDGINDYVQVPDNPLLTPPSMTLDAWINPTITSTGPDGLNIISKYNSNNPGVNGVSWIFFMENTGKLAFAVYGDRSGTVYREIETIDSVLTAGAWAHVAATFDVNTQRMAIIVDGSEVPSALVTGSQAVSAIADSATPVRIGTAVNGDGQPVGFWSGLIDEVEIFNRALSAAEIQVLFEAGGIGKCKESTNSGVFNSVWDGATGLLPDGACPSWDLIDESTSQDPILSGGILTLSTSGSFTENLAYRQTSPDLVIPDPWVIEFKARFVTGSSGDQSRSSMAVQFDTAPLFGGTFFIQKDEIFLEQGNLVKGPAAAVKTDDGFHTYRIEVTGTGSVRVFYDGNFVLLGTTFNNPNTQPQPSLIWGEGSNLAFGTSEWVFFRHNGHVDTGMQTCGLGACTHKAPLCVNGAPRACDPLLGATTEACNGLDDDCDGVVDEGFGETTCGLGACRRTVQNCEGGVLRTCVPGQPAPEVCNGADDNCDGTVDEGFDIGAPCSVGTNSCQRTGTKVCTADGLSTVCGVAPGQPTPEVCDGIDNDCDGVVDNGLAPKTCGLGACSRTVSSCVNGVSQTCTPGTPAAEICNGIDDDCDGVTDEGLGQTTCGLGGCQRTVDNCKGGVLQTCTPGAPVAEICNGIDDDCNGSTDEADSGGALTRSCYTGPAGTQGVGICHGGTSECVNGAFGPCIGEVIPSTGEISCNGLDDDCDGLTDETVGVGGQTYRSRAAFELHLVQQPHFENFDGYANGQGVASLFNGLVTFNSPVPTDFYGAWGPGEFSGGGLIPEPRFQGKPLVLNFSSPVFAVGANAFDDFDGSPLVNVVTLTVTTTLGSTFSISEDSNSAGDTGFLGATSSDGIVTATFSIDNTNGNLEIDLLEVSEVIPPVDADCDGFDALHDCDDHDPNIHPGAPELCDGKDNDCDGRVDDPSHAPFCAPDLTVTSVDTTALVGDWQSLHIVGTVSAVISNAGGVAVEAPFKVTFFEDSNLTGIYESGVDRVVGVASISDLAATSTTTVHVQVDDAVLFRDDLVYAFVDSDNVIAESDETNNYSNSGLVCRFQPPSGSFNPIVKWAWTSSSVQPDALNVMMTPAVVDLNGDGIPDVVFASTASRGGGLVEVGYLRALSGDSGTELFTVTDPAYLVDTASSVAVADIDLDGTPEIIACDASGARLIAFENDGTFKWRSPALEAINWGAPSIADLDGDGIPEIIVGRQVLSNTGEIKWTGTGGRGAQLSITGPLSLVADLDLDGKPEVVAGNTAYRADGSVYWQAPVPDGYDAVANFNSDPFPEVVIVSNGTVRLLAHDGTPIWGPVSVPGGGLGGPPTVADFDGDGEVEIGVAGANRYAVFETDGSLKWASPTQDSSSNVTGSSVFDFEGDGAAEVVYRDELYLRVYRGTDGTILFKVPMSSCTWFEYVLVADVDADGKAEIVAVANENCGFGPQRGVYVFGDANDSWVATRKIWNQHTYHITNVNDDATIPRVEKDNWLFPGPPARPFNNYRQNVLTGRSPLSAPDLTASYIQFATDAGGTERWILGRIGNGGSNVVGPGVPCSFYDGDPTLGGRLLGTTFTTKALEPGHYEDVKLVLPKDSFSSGPIWMVADDSGHLAGHTKECDETNNIHDSRLVLAPINRPPTARIKAIPPAECTMPAGVLITFDGTDSSDPDSDPLTYEWRDEHGAIVGAAPVVVLTAPLGDHPFSLKVDDGRGGSDSTAITVTVRDTQGPSISCPSDVVAECPLQPDLGKPVVSDACDANPTTGNDAPAIFPLGTTVVTWTAIDASHNVAPCAQRVTVRDTIPPQATISVSPSVLWPPNHRMVDIAVVVTSSDACTPLSGKQPTIVLMSVSSNEPDDANGVGDGNTTNDIQGADLGTADYSLALRAERDGTGRGRVYSLVYKITDSAGNVRFATAEVLVPHDQRGITEPLNLTLGQGSAGTLVRWDDVTSAITYSVIRGDLGRLKETDTAIDLGLVACVMNNTSQTSTAGHEDTENPASGEAFFYLAAYNDGWGSTYGTESASKPGIPASGDCK